MQIRQAAVEDAGRVAEIYNGYVLHTTITFENQAVPVEEMARRIREKLGSYDWIVAEVEQTVVGYAYYGSFRPRPAYAHTVETTLYLAPGYTGQGLGTQLYEHLIESIRRGGFRELIGVVALPNPASIALHRKMGFVEAGLLKNVGYKFGRYLDVSFWQKSLSLR